MATNSERQIGETLTDSLLIDILTPGYLPDVSALQVPPAAYQGKYLSREVNIIIIIIIQDYWYNI